MYVEIFIEIPNCFNNFLENYPILTYFEMKYISFETREKLRLDNEKNKFFKWMIPKKENSQTPEEYIKANIGTNKFPYLQINIFINLFMNQYKQDNALLTFLDENNNDITKECI